MSVVPRFRSGRITRAGGGLLIAIAVGATIAFPIAQGWSGFQAAPFTLGLAVLGAAAIRQEVSATPDWLIVNSGLRKRRIPWQSIDGFRVEASGCQGRVLVLLDGDRALSLPVGNTGVFRTRRGDAERMRNALEQYRVMNQRPTPLAVAPTTTPAAGSGT